jgi:hypothetical protein
MTPDDWSLDDAIAAFERRFPGEPRNIWRKHPEFVRSQMTEMADDVLALEPRNSNDFMLQGTIDDILSCLPPDLERDASSIFVARASDNAVQAEAWAATATARLVSVSGGLSPVMGIYALIARRTFHLIMRLDRTGLKDIGELLTRGRARISDLLREPDVATVLRQRGRWLDEGVVLNEQVQEIFLSWEETTSQGISTIVEMQDLAEHFVVAHEFAHHLLGHLQNPMFPFRLHPAIVHMSSVRKRLGLELDYEDEAQWNEDQVHELDCDAFAFLALAGEFGSSSWDRGRWYGAIFGALVALPALEDAALFGAVDGHSRSIVGESHPPMADRFGQLADFIHAFPWTDEDKDHPVGLLAQLLLYADVIQAARPAPVTG